MKKTLIIVNLLAGLLLLSCAKQTGGNAPSKDDNQNLVSIEPKTVALSLNNQVTFSASGGEGQYQYSVVSGNAEIFPETGTLVANGVGEVIVRVTDKRGNSDHAAITVNPGLTMLSDAINITHQQQHLLEFTGGTPPVTFELIGGQGSVDATTGLYTPPGHPTVASVKIRDGCGNSITTDINVVQPISVDSTQFTLHFGEMYQFNVTGGVAPYSFSINSGSGTIFQAMGIFIAGYYESDVVVRITDSTGDYRDVEITVIP